MRDSFLFQSLPLFSGALAFVGCYSPKSPVDETTGTDPTGTSSASTTMTTTTDPGSSSTDDPSTSLTTTTMTTLDTSTTIDPDTGDPECNGGTCGDPAEEGWFGPAVIARLPVGSELPSCTPEYPDAGPTLLDGFVDPGPATCDCTCELTQAPNCNGSVTSFQNANCGQWLNSVQVSENCSNISIPGSARFYSYGYGVGICDENEIEEIPPIPWEATIRTCRVPETALSCGDGGLCLPVQPEGFEDNWCMYRQGDFECPAGAYANKSLFWSGAEDTRGCSNCTCGSAGTNCNDTTVDVYAGADCEGLPVATLVGGNVCTNVTGLSLAASVGAASACPVTAMPEPEGIVEAQGEFTFCCLN